MNRNTYLVTSGEYSDYGVDGVFSRWSLAEAFKKEMHKNGETDARIEKWKTNQRAGHILRQTYTCVLNTEKGSIRHRSGQKQICHCRQRVFRKGADEVTCHATSLVSPEHAHKLAVEIRQKWLRKEKRKAKEAL